MKLVECVPNVSEGRDKTILAELSKALESVPGVSLLDIDAGAETNRTVYTFVGAPEAVSEAAFLLIKRAGELIDMRKHKGAHARIGATDVTPFVPLSGMTLQDCAELSRRLGERVGRELEIPVYYYEAAALRAERKNLAEIRKGEWEGLAQKLADNAWKPDAGPASYGERQARTGAAVIGARTFLVAYNTNLNTKDKKLANEIAFSIRESGRTKKDAAGNAVATPGTLETVKATGWVIEEYGCAQVSMNLTNLAKVGLAEAFEENLRQADRIGVRITGSEIVGLVPKDELVRAGRHFLRKMGKPTFLPEREIMQCAVRSLGLNELAPFELDKKVIEYRVAGKRPLASMRVVDFVDELSSDSPAPGGGSVAALMGSLAAALAAMVAAISVQKKDCEAAHSELADLGLRAQELKTKLTFAIDEDTDAFNLVLAAMRLPKASADELSARTLAIEKANHGATRVPLEVMRLGKDVCALAATLARKGFKASQSDAGVGALAAMACVEGAYYNVRINLKNVSDKTFSEATARDAAAIFAETQRHAADARRSMDETL